MENNEITDGQVLEEKIHSRVYQNFEDYSNELIKHENKKLGIYYTYKNCTNNNLILESSFAGLYHRLEFQDWGIISAYRKDFTKRENIQRNRELRGILNANEAGVYQLVGHWREAPEGMEYQEAEQKNLLTDVIERSYLVPRPKDMDREAFKNMLFNAMTIGGIPQDAILFHLQGDGYYAIESDGSMKKIGDKIAFNKIAQAYSQWVKKLNVPFVFEGIEKPSSIGGHYMFKVNNILG